MSGLLFDLRHAARNLRRNPGYTAVVALVLALGIGANATIFTMIDAVLLRPLPYRDPSRLVLLWEQPAMSGRHAVSAATFAHWREHAGAFESIAAADAAGMALTGRERPERVSAVRVTGPLLEVLGVNPAAGHGLGREPGGAVLTHRGWERLFGRDARILGQAVTLDDRQYVVSGVMPPGFRFPLSCDVFVPAPPETAAQRNARHSVVIARLREGVSAEAVGHQMRALTAAMEPGRGAIVDPMHEYLVRGQRSDLPVLMAAAAFVLLIACANVANLLLAKAAGRRHEIAVRMALGAGRGRLLRQLMAESLLLSVLAGLLSVPAAFWALHAIEAVVPPGAVPTGASLAPDARVLLFMLGLSICTGILFGLAPGWRASSPDVNEALKSGRTLAGAPRRTAMRGWLVAVEMGLSVVLLAGATLMIRTLTAVIHSDADTGKILTMRVALPPTRYNAPGQAPLFFREAVERMERLPGARSAALSSALPLSGWMAATPFEIAGQPAPTPRARPSAQVVTVSRGFFETMGAGLVKGRLFDDRDETRCIVNAAFERRFFPAGGALGGRLIVEHDDSKAPAPLEIVGVSADLRAGARPGQTPPQIFVPYRQSASREFFVCIRAPSRPMALAQAAQSAIHGIDRDQPVSDIGTMEQIRDRGLSIPRVVTSLMASFGALALVLALIGTWAVVSYSAAQRTREMGIRIALGATRGDVLRLSMRQGVRPAAIGLALGLAGAAAVARLLRGLLFGVPAQDAAILAGVAVLLAGSTLLATWLPARRAAAADPVAALRCE